LGEGEAVVRRYYEVLNRGGSAESAIAELEPLLHPDAEYVSPPDAVEPGTRRGTEGWRAALESMRHGLGVAARLQPEAFVERGDRVFARLSIRTGGTASGVEVDGPTIGMVWTVREGRVSRLEWRWDPDDARAIFEGRD
jgi:ketosteroid isomerase-like protein